MSALHLKADIDIDGRATISDATPNKRQTLVPRKNGEGPDVSESSTPSKTWDYFLQFFLPAFERLYKVPSRSTALNGKALIMQNALC